MLLITLAFLGCVPTVSLKSAQLRGPTPQGVRFDAMIAVENPNTFDVEIRAVRANVRMANVRGYLPVFVEPKIWIQAGRTAYVAVPIIVPWGMIPQIVAQTVTQPKVAYTVVGRADVIASRAFRIDQSNYEFDEEGELPRSFFVSVGRGPGPFGLGLGMQ